MPIQRIERLTDGDGIETGIRLHGAGSKPFVEVLYADVAGNPDPTKWNAAKLANFESLVQDGIDKRIGLNDPSLSEDPDGSTDPAREDLFYEGGDLVGRSIIFNNSSYNVASGTMSFSIRRTLSTNPAP